MTDSWCCLVITPILRTRVASNFFSIRKVKRKYLSSMCKQDKISRGKTVYNCLLMSQRNNFDVSLSLRVICNYKRARVRAITTSLVPLRPAPAALKLRPPAPPAPRGAVRVAGINMAAHGRGVKGRTRLWVRLGYVKAIRRSRDVLRFRRIT